jgi:hypothetical protein
MGAKGQEPTPKKKPKARDLPTKKDPRRVDKILVKKTREKNP